MSTNITDLAKPGDEGYVTKANSLIQLNKYIGDTMGRAPSLLESKLFAFAISRMDQTASELAPVSFRVRDFWEACGVTPNGKKYYTIVADALKKLRDRSGWVLRPSPSSGKLVPTLVALIEKTRFEDNCRRCEVYFDQDIAPALLNLKGNYTKYPDTAVMRLESRYGFALYEILCSYEYLHDSIRLSFSQLAEMLDASTYVNNPGNFKIKVIDAAVNDINEHSSDIFVSYKTEKTGRSMTHVVFTVTRQTGKCASIAPLCDVTDKVEQRVKEQIGYDALSIDIQTGTKKHDPQTLKLILETMVEVYTTDRKNYTINGSKIPTPKIHERYEELDSFHIEYVLESMTRVEKEVKNPRAYVRAALFNAPLTMDVHYTSKVNADMAKESDDNTTIYGCNGFSEAEIEAIQRLMASEM